MIDANEIKEGDFLYNEELQAVLEVKKDEAGNCFISIPHPETSELIDTPVEALDDSWKQVTEDDLPFGSLLWYWCHPEEELDNLEIDQDDLYEIGGRARRRFIELHPDEDIYFESNAQAGIGTEDLYSCNGHIFWDIQDEDDAAVDMAQVSRSYSQFINCYVGFLEEKYEQIEQPTPISEVAMQVLENFKKKWFEECPKATSLVIDTYQTIYEKERAYPDEIESWYGIESDAELRGEIAYIITYGEEGDCAVLIFNDGHLAHYGLQNDSDNAPLEECILILSQDAAGNKIEQR